MTREKAFEILDQFPRCNECTSADFPYSCDECDDVFFMALHALKEPEIVRCNDCEFGTNVKNGAGEDAVECSLDMEHLCHSPEWFCADGVQR